MPAIRSIRWRPFRLALRSDAGAAHGSLSFREGLLVVIEDEAGRIGLGEASPLTSYAGGTVEECIQAIGLSTSALVGRTPEVAWSTPLRFRPGVSNGTRAALACGIETALADILARSEQLPLHVWLGGKAESRSIPVNGLVDNPSTVEAAAEAKRLADAGFRTLKLKVGFDAATDAGRILAVREALDPGVALRIDANGAWDESIARAVLAVAASQGVSLAEQPVPPAAGPDAMARLRRCGVPIAADEGCRTVADFEALLRADAMDAIVVKPMVSGLHEAIRLLAASRTAAITTIVTTTFDSGVGVTLAAHLAATLPEPRPACGLATHDRLAFDIVEGVPGIVAGDMRVGSAHGLGLELNARALDRAATGEWVEASS